MRLEWLEDILAVLDTGSFSKAAEKRLLTQSAFTRRIRQIEEYVGADLFDRSRKPVELHPAVLAQEQSMRELAANLQALKRDFRRQGQDHKNQLTIACLHAITTSLAPKLVDDLTKDSELTVRLHAASAESCHLMLLSGKVDYTVIYQVEAVFQNSSNSMVETRHIGRERLLPVFSARHRDRLEQVLADFALPIIRYPKDVFLGQVLEHEILPRISEGLDLRCKAEAALTHAALQFALDGIGTAWLPLSLVRNNIEEGLLLDLSGRLPATEMNIAVQRLRHAVSAREEDYWQRISQGGWCSLADPAIPATS